MKWLFRIIALVLALFTALCIAGAFLPATQRVDMTTNLPVDAEDIYDVISDLRSYPDWSGVGGPDSDWVFGDEQAGVGQTAAWQVEDTRFGSLEILQVETNEYVRVRTIGPLGEQTITLAIDEGETETAFIMEAERHLGGFPYFGRIAALRQKSQTKVALETAANGLADLFR